MKQNKKIIGLTGNIASGKSVVSTYLIEKGFMVIDADLVSREVVKKNTEGLSKVILEFGDDVLLSNGELDRKALAKIVFNDKEELNKLNLLLHPLIRKEILNKISKSEEKMIFIDAALLYETELDKITDEVWFVSSNIENQIKRLMGRDNLTKEEALSRILIQEDQNEKMEKSKYVLENNGSIDDLINQIDVIIKIIGIDK